jgi:hypothetical protein
MELGRRAFLKLGGSAAVAATGYAGYEEINGGKWLFDPATLTAAHNKFFGLVDYGTLYEVAQEYSESDLDDVETPSGTLDPADLDQFAGVGSMSISGDNGVPTGVFAGGVSGSFEADIIEGPAKESSEIERVGTASGYNLWTAEVPSASESTELSIAPKNLAMGTKNGAAIGGAVRAPEANVESVDAVKRMISSKNGGVGHAKYLTNDGDYETIRNQFDSNPTFLFGALVDPAMVTLSTALSEISVGFLGGLGGPAGGGVADAVSAFIDAWFAELAAGAVGGTIDTDSGETTMRAFLTYNTASDAEQTGIVQLVNAASAEVGDDAEIEFDARYQGRSVVVRVTGDTETILDQSQQASVPETTPTGFSRT